jgi:hypothetical protein
MPTEVSGLVITVGNALTIIVANPQGTTKTIINVKLGVAYPNALDGSVITSN